MKYLKNLIFVLFVSALFSCNKNNPVSSDSSNPTQEKMKIANQYFSLNFIVTQDFGEKPKTIFNQNLTLYSCGNGKEFRFTTLDWPNSTYYIHNDMHYYNAHIYKDIVHYEIFDLDNNSLYLGEMLIQSVDGDGSIDYELPNPLNQNQEYIAVISVYSQ